MADKHPYDPFISDNATKLIIGTIPPHRFCVKKIEQMDVDFYYGSHDNYFWHLIGEVFGERFSFENTDEAVKQRKLFLQNHNIGITDIIKSCERMNDYSAADKHLFDRKYKDIKNLLKDHPKITQLIYTSTFVKTCMNKTLNTFHRSLKTDDKRRKKIVINNIEYDVVILYSPSPQALRNMGTDGSDRRIDQYRKVFHIDGQ